MPAAGMNTCDRYINPIRFKDNPPPQLRYQDLTPGDVFVFTDLNDGQARIKTAQGHIYGSWMHDDTLSLFHNPPVRVIDHIDLTLDS